MTIPQNTEHATTARPRQNAEPPVIDVLIPECDPAEAALLGSVGYDAAAITLATIDMFVSPLHQNLWRELAAFLGTDGSISDNGAPDVVKLVNWFKSHGVSKSDRDYFTDCVRDVPSAAGAAGYAGIVRYKYVCRELIRLSQDLGNGASSDAILDTIIADAKTRLDCLQQIGQAGGLGAVMQCVSDIEPREITWLWYGRIPLGRISMLVGRPGEGKSFLTAFMASTISIGGYWPDGTHCPQGHVILVSGEDDPADTIRPRLDAHGADCSKIFILKTVAYRDSSGQKKERGFTLADIAQLEQALIDHPGVKIIFIDPIGSFLGGKVDGHRDNEIRAVLAPLAALAEKYNCAIVIVAHRRKSAAVSADDMALGSIGFVGLSRAVWHLSRDENNPERRLLLPGKMNLCRQPDGLAFSIGGEPAAIQWEDEPVKLSADQQLEKVNGTTRFGPEPEARNNATDWLRKLLTAGSMLVESVKENAKAAGVSWRTVERAAATIPVSREQDIGTKKWRWMLPPESSSPSHSPSSPANLADAYDLATWRTGLNKEQSTPKTTNSPSSLCVASMTETPFTPPPEAPPAKGLFNTSAAPQTSQPAAPTQVSVETGITGQEEMIL